jgi:FlaA1/EpsC-like NDP-sugar epimerase
VTGRFARLATRYRRPAIIVAQAALAALSNYFAFLLRFDGGPIPEVHLRPFLIGLPILIVYRSLAFAVFRLHHGLWRYASIWDLQAIVASVALSSIAFAATIYVAFAVGPYPRWIHVIDALVMICLLGGVRLLRRIYHDFERVESGTRVLIFGAGDAGEMLVRDMKHNRAYSSEPIGFIDDDPAKVGRSIHGVRVLGTRDDLPRILTDHTPDEVIVAIPRAQPGEVRAIVRSLEHFNVPIKTLPNLRDILSGRIPISQVRSLALEDLMSRRPVDLDIERVQRLVRGRRVLVTGAGGSIGAELSRQLAQFNLQSLVLLDRYENTLFELGQDLRARGVEHRLAIADIADARRIDRLFAAERPELVFHAAAHKHVPLMEADPSEAVKNNVAGTRTLAEAAAAHAVSEFVLISSDKAVNPSSVMGATKRVAELIVRAATRDSATRFVVVRFGNVLGSNGSVVGLFQQQIAKGGPVTVTHRDMRRYFMLIPEAVSLVLHAASMEGAGAIYALDMGEQISLVEFARNMIRLAGYIPDEEIPITFVGARPGEKLSEELWEKGEVAEPSEVEKVFRVRPGAVPVNLRLSLTALEAAAAAERDQDVIALLADLVPTFTPDVRFLASQPATVLSTPRVQ